MQAVDTSAERESLQQFLHVVSHDLAAPLRQIISFGEILQEEEAARLSPDGRIYLDHLVHAGEHLQDLLSGLLSLARVHSRGRALEPCELDAVLSEELQALAPTLESAGARVERGELPAVIGDARQLGQLFHELIANAVKFARPGEPPRLSITAVPGEAPGMAAVIVRDDGIGFDPQEAETIFGVFQRLDPEDGESGTGIGLTLCRRICERHGGAIRATGVPGGGACFRIDLPAAVAC